MFVTNEVWELLNSPVGVDDWEQRVASLRADLETFIEGTPIDPKYLFLLYPSRDGVWEIRSVRPDPSVRILGSFADVDVFIATTYAKREDLGGWQSREWKQIKRRAGARWNALLHPYRPIISSNVNDVVTGAINAKYFRDPPPQA